MDITGRRQLVLGASAVALALLLLVVIPATVSTPSNVPRIVLSPLFWPYVLAGSMAAVGLALMAMSRRLGKAEPGKTGASEDTFDERAAMARLAGIAVAMLASLLALPVIGMVWTSIALFAVTAFLVKTRNPVIALVSAVLLPFALYAFFAHVAGISIPQGSWAAQFVRLP